jgi:hypothetical protein
MEIGGRQILPTSKAWREKNVKKVKEAGKGADK